MRRLAFLLVVVLLLLLPTMKSAAQEDDPVASLPDGPGKDLLKVACVQCHSLKTSVAPRKTAEAWKTTVYDMISRGAQVFPDEADVIIEYLSRNRGPEF